MGTDLDGDCLPVAKEELTFMVMSHKPSFKVPTGFSSIGGLSSTNRSNEVLQALDKLYSVGTHFRRTASNLGVAKTLGCDLVQIISELTLMVRYWQARVCTSRPCSMSTLIRNPAGESVTFLYGQGNKATWHIFERLHQQQESEGFI